MAAWQHNHFWDSRMFEAYRKFVGVTAPTFRGEKEDCADLSITLLVKFAAANGLPVTFKDNDETRYISKATRQSPRTAAGRHRRQEGEDFGELSRAAPAEPPLNVLKAGSPGGSPYPSPGEEMSHEAHLRKTGGRQSRRNEADTQTRSS
jgi:hypothetical protein